MSNDENIYEIFADRRADVEAAIAKINRRAEKLGVPAIELTFGEVFTKSAGKNEFGEEKFYNKVKVTVSSESVKLEGWKFVATLQHTGEGNIVRTIPGVELDTTKYRDVEAWCDHCQTLRPRNDTYLVLHEDGTLKQVGSSCIKDFLGHDPRGALWQASFLAELDGFMGEFDDFAGGERIKPVFKIEKYLGWVAAAIRNDGWVSRGKAYEWDRTATADWAISVWDWKGRDPRPFTPTDEDFELGAKALEWARSIDRNTNSDYLYNLLIASTPNYITYREFGLVASAVSAYQREVEKKVAAERESKVSEFQGEVGKREVFENLTVERVIYNDGAYGVTFITKLVDENGNVFTWFASKELEQGQTYTIKATVKAHEEYKGVKQTIITRGKVQ